MLPWAEASQVGRSAPVMSLPEPMAGEPAVMLAVSRTATQVTSPPNWIRARRSTAARMMYRVSEPDPPRVAAMRARWERPRSREHSGQ